MKKLEKNKYKNVYSINFNAFVDTFMFLVMSINKTLLKNFLNNTKAPLKSSQP